MKPQNDQVRQLVRRVFSSLLVGALCSGSLQHAAGQSPSPVNTPKPSLIAVTASEEGKVFLLDREKLTTVRAVAPRKSGPTAAPMLVAEDNARRVFYVGNFGGGLGKIPMDGGEPQVLDLGGPLIGLSVSPDGKLLAVNGAYDLTLRLIDIDTWKVKARRQVGNPNDNPRHLPLTHGLASTHPIWLPDSSGVLTQDNIHEEVVLVGRDGKELARRPMRSAVHTFVIASADKVLALAEGTMDGQVRPAVAVLEVPSLKVAREIEVPLADEEPAKLHHASLSPNGEVLIVANMGPMHGDKFGRTVAALNWRTGETLWSVEVAKNAGHVRFLDKDRVMVLGHRDPDLVVLDAATGKKLETWTVPEAQALGHSIEAEPDGRVLVINSTTGRLVRLGKSGVIRESASLGDGVTEASLPE